MTQKAISPRERIQNEIVTFLSEYRDDNGNKIFNAPYGVIPNLHKFQHGGTVRKVTFGCSCTLDAIVTIWNEKKITVEAEGKIAYKFNDEYSSVTEFIEALKNI